MSHFLDIEYHFYPQNINQSYPVIHYPVSNGFILSIWKFQALMFLQLEWSFTMHFSGPLSETTIWIILDACSRKRRKTLFNKNFEICLKYFKNQRSFNKCFTNFKHYSISRSNKSKWVNTPREMTYCMCKKIEWATMRVCF